MEMAPFCYMTCGWHSDYMYDLWIAFCTDIYLYIIVCRELKKNKLKRNKQRALPSACWRQRRCRRLADGKGDTWRKPVQSGLGQWPFGQCFAVSLLASWRQREGWLPSVDPKLTAKLCRQPVHNPWQTTAMWAQASALPSARRQADGNARR